MKKQTKKAFSLIELIFVIAVIGIISSIAIPKFLDSRSSAIVTSIKKDISTITTSVQSHYMLNNGISKITDSVNINSSIWTIEDKKVEYKVDKSTCIKIEIANSKLELTINETTSDICQKIYDSGIRTMSYELF